MIAPTVQETISCSQQMLQQANISHEQISRILLVGGSCRIPYVQHMLQQTFKSPINAVPDLELVVCQGAALYATQHEIGIVSATPGEAKYTTIEAALQQAKPHSRIVVRPGIYQENLVLDRDIEIVGEGAREEIIITSSAAIGIKMATSTALMRGITLQHTGTEAITWNTHGGVVVAQGHLTLENCTIETAVQGVSIWGPESQATLHRCLIHAGKNAGIAINNGGQATIEGCDIADSIDAGIHVRDKDSIATIQRCSIHDGQAVGISISSAGQAVIEHCDIAENAATGIQIRDEKSSAIIRHSLIHGGKDKGIAVWQKGQVLIEEECDIFANMHTGILVGDDGSQATIKQSKVRDGKFVGIDILHRGYASIEACDIFGNAGSGIRTRDEGSRITVAQSQLHDGKNVGIMIWGKSQGELEGCHIFRNVGPGIGICNTGSKAAISQCDIRENTVGVMLQDEGEATVKDSIIEKNHTNICVDPESILQYFASKEIKSSNDPGMQDRASVSDIAIWRQAPKPEPVTLHSPDQRFNCDDYLAFVRSLLQRHQFSTQLTQDIQTRIQHLEQRAHDPKFYVAFVGEFNSGKTTFINALLREELLKQSVVLRTSVPTRIQYGATPDLAVCFVGEQTTLHFTAHRAQLQKKMCQINPQLRQAQLATMPACLHLLTTDKLVAPRIQEVTVFHQAHFLRHGIVIIDTPGFNSSTESHQDITRRVLNDEADLAIITIPAYGALSGSLVKFLQSDLQPFLYRSIVMLTHMDIMTEQEQSQIFTHVHARLQEIAPQVPHIQVHPSAAQIVLDELDPDVIVPETKRAWLSRFSKLETTIWKWLAIERAAASTESLLRLLDKLLEDLTTQLQKREISYQSRQLYLNPKKGHSGSVWSIVISPDGQILIRSSQDKTIKIWNVQTGQPLRTISGHLKGVFSVAISPSGLVAGGDKDGMIYTWENA